MAAFRIRFIFLAAAHTPFMYYIIEYHLFYSLTVLKLKLKLVTATKMKQ